MGGVGGWGFSFEQVDFEMLIRQPSREVKSNSWMSVS